MSWGERNVLGKGKEDAERKAREKEHGGSSFDHLAPHFEILFVFFHCFSESQ